MGRGDYRPHGNMTIRPKKVPGTVVSQKGTGHLLFLRRQSPNTGFNTMGCHTWFYKKDTITLQEALDIARSVHQETADTVTLQWTLADVEKWKGYFQCVVRRPNDPLRILDERGVFLETEEYHDLFRIGNYPETRLYSLEETEDFIEDQQITEVDWVCLKEFWERYPDGLIKFG